MNATVDAFLITIPPLVVYLTVGLVVAVESLGVQLPGEIVLVSAESSTRTSKITSMRKAERN